MYQKLLHRLLRVPLWLWAVVLVVFAIGIRQPYWQYIGVDDEWWRTWGAIASQEGVAKAYLSTASAYLPANYPPLYVLLMRVVGEFSFGLSKPELFMPFLHVVLAVVDALCGVLLYCLVVPEKGKKWAVAAAVLWVVNPVVIFESAWWGQNDVLMSFWMLLALLAVKRKVPWLVALSLTAGVLTKTQFIVLIPLLLVWILATKQWSTKQWIHAVAVSISTFIVVLAPIIAGGALPGMVTSAYLNASKTYPYLTLNAYNIWWLSLSNPINWTQYLDSVVIAFGLTAKQVGLLVFAASYLLLGAQLLHRIQKVSLGELSWYLSHAAIAFYLFPTQMHERYLFPFFALGLYGAISAAGKTRKIRLTIWALLTFASLYNLIAVQAPTYAQYETLLPMSRAIAWLLVVVFAGGILERSLPSHER